MCYHVPFSFRAISTALPAFSRHEYNLSTIPRSFLPPARSPPAALAALAALPLPRSGQVRPSRVESAGGQTRQARKARQAGRPAQRPAGVAAARPQTGGGAGRAGTVHFTPPRVAVPTMAGNVDILVEVVAVLALVRVDCGAAGGRALSR